MPNPLPMLQVNSSTVVGASGEYSDFQQILKYLEEISTQDFCADDDNHMRPQQVHAYLTRVLYNRRNKFDPLWNSLVIGGVQDGQPYLGACAFNPPARHRELRIHLPERAVSNLVQARSA